MLLLQTVHGRSVAFGIQGSNKSWVFFFIGSSLKRIFTMDQLKRRWYTLWWIGILCAKVRKNLLWTLECQTMNWWVYHEWHLGLNSRSPILWNKKPMITSKSSGSPKYYWKHQSKLQPQSKAFSIYYWESFLMEEAAP